MIMYKIYLILAVVLLSVMSICLLKAEATCTDGCFLVNNHNDATGDWHTSTAICITNAKTTGSSSASCPVLTSSGGTCNAPDEINQIEIEIYRCCVSPGKKAQSAVNAAMNPDMGMIAEHDTTCQGS
jgi:hypothetical protein